MFNVDLKSPELSMRAAAAGLSRKSQAPDLCGEHGGGAAGAGRGGGGKADVPDPALRSTGAAIL